MSQLTRLPAHEQKLAEKRCFHRTGHLNKKLSPATRAKHLRWARWYRYKIRKQMGRLYKDAHKHGGGGWRKDGRGWRYQLLGGAYTGKLCFTPLHVSGNRVVGGTPRERLVKAMDAAVGNRHRRSFYSQSGRWTVSYAITGEPYGCRSDCSSWYTSLYKTCGLPDPNGNNFQGGYTGTLGSHGRAISESEAQPGDAVLYGPWPHHHVEAYRGPGQRTAGHGSAPVDYGSVHMLGGEVHFRRYI